MTSPVRPGAEPWSAAVPGGGPGVLCLHGFGGTPSAMRAMGAAFAAAGFAVEVPLLPGHGTTSRTSQPPAGTTGRRRRRRRSPRLQAAGHAVVVVGQSMGAALALWLATRHADLAGLVCINAASCPSRPRSLDMLDEMLAAGEEVIPSGRPDIADPVAVDVAYEETPLRPLRPLQDEFGELRPRLGEVGCPLLAAVSPQDHVIDPASSDVLAASVGGPV